jgi:hypothetical protein
MPTLNYMQTLWCTALNSLLFFLVSKDNQLFLDSLKILNLISHGFDLSAFYQHHSKPKAQSQKSKVKSQKSKVESRKSKVKSPKPKAQNPKPKIQSPKSKAQNSKLKTQSLKLKTQNPKLKA